MMDTDKPRLTLCAIMNMIVNVVLTVIVIFFIITNVSYSLTSSCTQKELLEIEKAYNASYKPDLATELSKKCNEDMKKLLTPRLTGSKHGQPQ